MSKLIKKESTAPTVAEQIPSIAPPVDIYENATELLLIADVPGVINDNVELHLEDDHIKLTARRGTELIYRRSFLLPDGFDFAKAAASLTDGVLTVRLPKAEARQPRRIAVKAS